MPHKVTVQLQWKHQFEFAGFYAAIQQGFYAQRGLEVELREYHEGLDVVEEVLAGRAQYGVFHSGIVQARLEGQPVKLLANYFKRMPMVLLTTPDILSLADLRHKRLMVSAKDTSSPLFRLAFEAEGLEPEIDVEFLPHTFDIGPLVRREVDAMSAFVTNEPFYLEQRGIAFNTIELAEYMPSMGDGYLFSSESQTRRYPKLSRAFIEATNEGWRYALAHQEEIVDLILTDYSQRKGREALLYEARMTEKMVRPLPLPIGALFESLIIEVAELIRRQQEIEDRGQLEGFLFESIEGHELGVELSAAERRWLSEHPEIVLSMTDQFPPALIRRADGNVEGLVLDYIDLLNRRLGSNITLNIVSSWSEAGKMALEGQTDGLAVASDTPAWREHFHLTSPFLSVDTYLYIRSDQEVLGTSIDAWAGKRVGYLQGTRRLERLVASNPAIEAVPLESNQAIAAALGAGEVDMVVGDVSVEYWRREHLHSVFKVGGLLAGGESDIHFAIRKDWQTLAAILDKGLASISEREKNRIRLHWLEGYPLPLQDRTGVELSETERAWLQGHTELRYCYSPDWRPYDFTEDGQHQGMFADYLALLGQRLGVRLVPVHTQNWGQALEQVRLRGCDLLSGAVDTPERQEYLSFTQPYFDITNVLIARADKPFVSGLEALKGERIGVLSGSAMEELLRLEPAEVELVSGLTEELIGMLDRGEIHAAVLSLEHAAHYVGSSLYSYKIIAKLDHAYPISIAVRRDWPELLSIMDKVVASLSGAEHNDIRHKWAVSTLREQVDYTLLWQVVGVGLLLLGLVGYWNRRLRLEMARRTRVEQALSTAKRETDEVLRIRNTILDNAMVTIALLVERRFTWVNDHMQTMFGYPPEEVLGRSVEFLYADPDDFHRIGVESPSILAKGESFQGEFRYRRKDGSVIWCLISGKAIDASDPAQGAIYIVSDINERKSAEMALARSREEYQLLIDDIGPNFIIYIHRDDGVLEYVSKGVKNIFGCTPEQAVGQNFSEITSWSQESLEQASQRIENMLASGEAVSQWEMYFTRPDGSTGTLLVSSHPLKDDNGRYTKIAGIVEDITERKLAQQREALEKRRLQLLNHLGKITGSSLELGKVLSDALEQIRHHSDADGAGFWEYMLDSDEVVCRLAVGIGATEMTGTRLPMGKGVISDTIANGAAVLVEDTRLEPRHIQFDRRTRGPEVRSLIYVPLLHQGRMLGVLSLVDTEPHRFHYMHIEMLEAIVGTIAGAVANARLYSELLLLKERAEAANRAKSAFLANMSHELRTPLNAMLGYAQILMRDQSLSGVQRQGVETIKRSGDHLLTLINDVLDLAKVEAGRFELVAGPCDLLVLLHSLEELFRLHCAEKGLDFELRLSDDLPKRVELDERRLRQVIVNLLGNAVKFTDQGEIRLLCSVHPSRNGLPEQLLIEVEDSGMGIAAEQLPTLFKPFQQEGEALYKSQGTGLGLAISKSLVEQMGGELRVESRLGEGSRFYLSIPIERLVDDSAPLSGTQGAPLETWGYFRSDGGSEPFTLLLVDDIEENLEVLRGLLQPLGFEVREAIGGEAAVAAATAEPPDLVLMDLVMPDLNGLEATRRILAQPMLSGVPIVACSASAFEEDREQSMAAGCVDHLAKPVDADALFRVIERYLPMEWSQVSQEDTTSVVPSASFEPSVEQREQLKELVQRGKILQLRNWLEQHSEEHGAWMEEMREAVKRFDMKRVRLLLKAESEKGGGD